MMSYPVLMELASQRQAETAAHARRARPDRNPLRGDAGFHEKRDLVRVVMRLRALVAQP